MIKYIFLIIIIIDFNKAIAISEPDEYKEFNRKLAAIKWLKTSPNPFIDEIIDTLENTTNRYIAKCSMNNNKTLEEKIEDVVSFFRESSQYLTILSWEVASLESDHKFIEDHIMHLWSILMTSYMKTKTRLTSLSINKAQNNYKKTRYLLSLHTGD